MTWIATLSSRGRLVLPKALREKLGAKPGMKVVFTEREGRFEFRLYGGDLGRWYGAAKREEVPYDLEQLRFPPGVEARLTALLDRQNRGDELTPEERREAEGLVDLSELLSLLRLRAQRCHSPS